MDNILIGKDKINIFFYYVFLDYIYREVIIKRNNTEYDLRFFHNSITIFYIVIAAILTYICTKNIVSIMLSR